MFIGELLIRRNHVKMQVEELKNYLKSEDTLPDINEILNELFELEDKHQQYSIVVEDSNKATEIEFGSSKITMANIVKLRNTATNKINVFTDLIENNKSSLNIVNLMEQRAKLVEEYILLSKAVGISDWQVEVD